MKQRILIAHARGEEALAEEIAAPFIEEGYEVIHIGSIEIGEAFVEESSRLLTERTPVLLCATFKAVASRWARQLVNAARSLEGVKVFALQMDEEVFIDQLVLGEKYGRYWENPTKSIKELKDAFHKYYPVKGNVNPGIILQASIDNYYARIRRRYQRLDLDSLTPREKSDYLEVQLRSVYVEQHVRDNPPQVYLPKEIIERLQENHEFEQADLPEDVPLEDVKRVSDVYYKKTPRPVLDVLSEAVNQYIVILGDPGSGKSTLTRYIILSLIDTTQDSKIATSFPDYLPLLVELKDYIALTKSNDKYKNFLDFFGDVKEKEGYYFEKEVLHIYLKNTGKAIVIFDGLDEIFEPREREQVCRQIDDFRETYSGTRIIVTSRILGFPSKILAAAGFKIYTLQDLDESQIEEFVEKWYSIAMFDKQELVKERCNLIMTAIKDSISIRQLAGNPMLLTIMAILAKKQELPRERWKLYDHAAQVLIELWDVNRYLQQDQLKYIDGDDKREMLQKIALKMQIGMNEMAGNYIMEKDLQDEFERYIMERFRESPGDAKTASHKMILQLRERNFILSQYGAKLYGFVHRAFLEYFCALSFLHSFKNTQKISLEQLQTDVFGKYWCDQSWHEVLRLVAGMIEPEFAGEIINFLSEKVEQEFVLHGDKPSMTSPLNLALAIKCLAEVKKIHLLADPAQKLLARICLTFDTDMILRPALFLFFKQQILPLARLIGTSWPERDNLALILKERNGNDYAYIYDNLFGSFIGYIGKGSDKVHEAVLEYAYHESATLRVSAPFALAIGWRDDPSTFPLLCELADHDPHRTVCYAAIYALAQHYSNEPITFQLLMRNAVFNLHEFGRAAAITGLADHYHDKYDIFKLIEDISRKETGKFPRTVAIKALGEYFQLYDGTYELLLHAAKNDESPKPDDIEYADPNYVRDAALDAIFRHWPNDENTLMLLQDRIDNDKTTWLRQKAKVMLEVLIKRKTQETSMSERQT